MSPERYLRPESIVVDEGSLIPGENLIRPPPNRFTHELVRAEPFYFSTEESSKEPNGTFEPGTRVVLLRHDGGPRCRVADGRGLHVEVAFAGLAELRDGDPAPG